MSEIHAPPAGGATRAVEMTSIGLGHSTIATTMDLYGHILPGAEIEAAALVDACLERATEQTMRP